QHDRRPQARTLPERHIDLGILFANPRATYVVKHANDLKLYRSWLRLARSRFIEHESLGERVCSGEEPVYNIFIDHGDTRTCVSVVIVDGAALSDAYSQSIKISSRHLRQG